MKHKESIGVFELLYVVYYYGFILLKPILQLNENNSTVILIIFVILVFSIFFSKLLMNKEVLNLKTIIIFILLLLILWIDALIRNNSYSIKYFYSFVYFGLIPVILLSQIGNYKKVLKYIVILSFCSFMLYASDPINNYSISKQYMTFGFTFLTIYIGIFIGCHYFKIKWLILFEVISLLLIILYANRSIILSIILFNILYYYSFGKVRLKSAYRYIIISCGLLAIYFIRDIIEIMLFTSHEYGIASYSFNHFYIFLDSYDYQILFSGRLSIWELSYKMLYENILFGSGLGSFQNRYGVYSHNLFLDLFIFYGILGVGIISYFITRSIKTIINSHDHIKLFGIILFALWFPKLMFSIYFMEEISFWSFIGYGLMYITSTNRKDDVNYQN